SRPAVEFVLRPFEGLPGEPDWVAMREVVPAATATARTTAEHGSRDVVVATVLPMAWPALHRGDGTILLALQQNAGSGDTSRDLASSLLRALDLPAGTPLTGTVLPEPGPRLQDVLDLTVPFVVTVHEGFDFWTAADVELTPDVRASLDRMNESVVPTVRIDAVGAAYWARMGEREYLRWAVPQDEQVFIDALARLHAKRESGLGEGNALGKFIGAFRSCGVLVPVWDLAPGTEADELAEPLLALSARLDAALALDTPLDANERRARAGLVARQLTLR
ncbi:MAG: topoisomerase II, partial [Cellulomonadaceae bacterium]|nr:topoisomerase II [Cellulomonadaceae bacterium]